MTSTYENPEGTVGASGPVLACALALALVAAGCGDDDVTGPGEEGVPGTQLTFVQPSDTAPPLLTRDTSFVATRGEDLKVTIFYEDRENPGEPGEEFLEFELNDGSLLRYPEDHPRAGALFQAGDTVTIRIQVAGDTLLADFGPDGLEFDPDEPAELTVSYFEADRDTDDDGEEDEDFEDEIDLWRQEAPGEPWFRAGRLTDVELDEIEADITSFTRFAAAI